MKKLTCFFIALAFIKVAYAGPETFSSKEVAPAPTTPPTWYRDNEWNISAWFAYAFPGTDDDRNSLADTFSANPGPGTYDRFLADNHAFGGGAEVKYFFRRYFGIGIEGFALAADGTSYTVENFGATAAFKDHDEHVVGGALGTLTFRYPIGQTRFAPYVWVGVAEPSAATMRRPFTLAEFLSASATMPNPVQWGNLAAGSRSGLPRT